MRVPLDAVVRERVARHSDASLGIVLVYHRIGALGGAAATLGAEVAPAVFERQLRHLRAHYRVVPLSEVAATAAGRRSRERFAVALTFDDDLESHASAAAPALAAADLSATFFLTGASLGGPAPFWWDDLARVIDSGRSVRALPDQLQRAASAGSRRAVAELARRIEEAAPRERAEIAHELREAAGSPLDSGLRAADVAALAAAGFEIGFHTRHHHHLPSLDDEDLRAALVDGRSELEAAAGAAITRIAYPHGRADDRVAAAGRAAGYVEGFTGAAQPIGRGTSPLLIPRYAAAPTTAGLARQLAFAVSRADAR